MSSSAFLFFLRSPDVDPRVTVPGEDQDQVAVALSRGKLRSSSQILPTVHIKSRYLNQFCLTTLTRLLVPPLSKRMYVFGRDLKRLITDLRATDDEVAVIRRYGDELVSKSEVCCEPWTDFGEHLLTFLKGCQKFREAGKNETGGQRGRACSCP